MCRDIGHKLCYSLKIFLDHASLVRKGLKFQFENTKTETKQNSLKLFNINCFNNAQIIAGI